MSDLPTTADVVIAGAGLAGLTAARVLVDAGFDVAVIEASDAVGGRVRTDQVDGFRLDRGFQLINPSYPRLKRDIDLRALELKPFQAGAQIAHGETSSAIGDPRRLPRTIGSTLRFPVGSWREKLAITRALVEIGYGSATRLKNRPDDTLATSLDRRGVTGALRNGPLRLYLGGVLGEDDLETSAIFGELLIRSFVRGTPAVPAAGMQALPEQIADRLPAGTVRLGTAIVDVKSGRVDTSAGTIQAKAVVVATDPRTAAELLGWPEPVMRNLTTAYFDAGAAPTDRALVHLDSKIRGVLVNTAVMSNAAPTYAEHGSLVAATTLLRADTPDLEPSIRQHAALLYGVPTTEWTLIKTYAIPDALPAMPPGTPLRRAVALGDGVFVAGDHRDTPSLQGALVSGHRAAAAVKASLRGEPPPAI